MGKISVDLYKKPTHCNKYILTTSVHPLDCKKIFLIVWQLESEEFAQKRTIEFLIERKYKPSLIDAAMQQAKAPQGLRL